MEAFGIYSLKASIILFIFWSIYQLCLQKETFYRFNRFFLIIGMIASLLCPLIQMHYPVEVEIQHSSTQIKETVIPSIDAIPENFSLTNYTPSWFSFLLSIYMLGTSVILIFRFIGLGKLFKVIHRHGYENYNQYKLVESSDFQNSFSFFKFIFISSSLENTYDREIILKHEKVHIDQRHFLDMLLSNLLTAMWWFNPIVWLYDRDIRKNHEYLADEATIREYNKSDYLTVLVNQWVKIPVLPLSNSFSYSNQIKRIKMMKKNFSNPAKKLFALAILPALSVFFWAFAEPEYITVMNEEPFVPEVLSLPEISDETISLLPVEIKENNSISRENTGNTTALVNNFLSEKLSLNVPLPKVDIPTPSLTQRNDNLDPLSNSGNRVNPFKDEPLVVILKGDTKIKGKKILSRIDPNDIESLKVLKGEEAIKEYGEEAADGVILITTKSKANILEDDNAGSKPTNSIIPENANIDIKGKVLDNSGKEIIGAIIMVKGSSRGSVTDMNGKFRLLVALNEKLVISYPGYAEKEMEVNNKKEYYTIQLKPE